MINREVKTRGIFTHLQPSADEPRRNRTREERRGSAEESVWQPDQALLPPKVFVTCRDVNLSILLLFVSCVILLKFN